MLPQKPGGGIVMAVGRPLASRTSRTPRLANASPLQAQALAQQYAARIQQAFAQAAAQAARLIAQWVAGTLTVTAAVLVAMITALVAKALAKVLRALWRQEPWKLGQAAAEDAAGGSGTGSAPTRRWKGVPGHRGRGPGRADLLHPDAAVAGRALTEAVRGRAGPADRR